MSSGQTQRLGDTALVVLSDPRNMTYSGRPEVLDFDEIAVLNGYANEIVPRLYLGSEESSGPDMLPPLRSLSVTGILNVTTDSEAPCSHASSGIRYARIAISDNESASLTPYLPGAASFIEGILSSGGSCLVHCQRGVSRSASVVLAYLMAARGLSRDEAYKLAKRRRRVVDPNVGFWRQLKDYETSLSTRSGDGDRDGNPPSSEPKFDSSWCVQSLASYSLSSGDAFAGLVGLSEEGWRPGLAAALDHVLGRSMAKSDVGWLAALVGRCGDAKEEGGDERGAIAFLRNLVQDPEFLECWESDFSVERLNKLVDDVEELSRTNP
jgi:atypical dual specificity phosphatase